MNNGTSLKSLFQGLIPDSCGIIQGTVISASPLQIRAENDDKLIINELLLIVPHHLTNHKVTVDIGNGNVTAQTSSVDGHSHELMQFALQQGIMTVYNGLKVGEKVHLLSLNNGKKYYILDRTV